MVITGNDEIGLAFQCAGEYLVVVGVIVDFVHFHPPGNKIDDLRKGLEEPVNLLRRCFVNLLKLGAKKVLLIFPSISSERQISIFPCRASDKIRAGFPVGTR